MDLENYKKFQKMEEELNAQKDYLKKIGKFGDARRIIINRDYNEIFKRKKHWDWSWDWDNHGSNSRIRF